MDGWMENMNRPCFILKLSLTVCTVFSFYINSMNADTENIFSLYGTMKFDINIAQKELNIHFLRKKKNKKF